MGGLRRRAKEIRQGILVGIFSSFFLLILVLLDFAWAGYASAHLHRGEQPYFKTANRFLYDIFFAWRSSSEWTMKNEAEYTRVHPEKTILIFYIDKLTLKYAKEHFHEDFPWPRSRYAGIISALSKTGSRAIGVDVLFSNPGQGDAILEKALLKTHAVIASRFIYAKNTIQAYEPPIFKGISCGFVDVTQDEDRVVRQSILRLPTPFSASPWSFDAVLLKQALCKPLEMRGDRLSFEGAEFPLRQGVLMQRKAGTQVGSFLASDVETATASLLDVNYLIPNNFVHYPLYSLWSEERKARLGEARNKIVLIGANASEGSEIFGNDLFATPLGLMSGVEIHAHALRTLLEHRPVVDFPPYPFLLALSIFGVGLLYGGGLPLFQGWVRFFFGSFILIGEIALAYLLFRNASVRLPLSYLVSSSLLDFGSISFYFYVLSRKEIESVRHLFEGYLSPTVVSTLLEEENRSKIRKQLAGNKQTSTILYSDIRGFTNLSEQLPPEEVVALLNEYFPPMTSIVHELGGYLDKFIGDAIMAVFSAPFPQADDPWRAVDAAIRMQKALKRLSENWQKQGKPVFQVGIGINTGEVVLGNVGSEYKKDYTVIGDSVNVASRLCGMALGGQILISEATYIQVKDKVKTQALGSMTVKGKEVPVETYLVSYE